LVAYQEAAALARQYADPFLLAHTVRHAGDVLYELRRTTEADACCNEALAIYRSKPGAPPLDLANAIRSFALVKERVGAAGEASLLWEEAKQIYASLGVQAGVAESEARLAGIARRRSRDLRD
jgi:tetratricopeptide (TPR) repeat protein